ncbi:hypothetical protein EJB05_39708, partial [Eragrostis curvula]
MASDERMREVPAHTSVSNLPFPPANGGAPVYTNLYFHERILDKLTDDDTFALPFWNWDSPGGMTLPPILAKELAITAVRRKAQPCASAFPDGSLQRD